MRWREQTYRELELKSFKRKKVEKARGIGPTELVNFCWKENVTMFGCLENGIQEDFLPLFILKVNLSSRFYIA